LPSFVYNFLLLRILTKNGNLSNNYLYLANNCFISLHPFSTGQVRDPTLFQIFKKLEKIIDLPEANQYWISDLSLFFLGTG
jgi:hypothetical protein